MQILNTRLSSVTMTDWGALLGTGTGSYSVCNLSTQRVITAMSCSVRWLRMKTALGGRASVGRIRRERAERQASTQEVRMQTEETPVAGGSMAAGDNTTPVLVPGDVVGGHGAAGSVAPPNVGGSTAAGSQSTATGPTLFDVLRTTTGSGVQAPDMEEPSGEPSPTGI